jgi:hypothetical protein
MIAITDQAPHQNRAPMLRYAIEGEQQIAREGEADRVSISSKCQRLLKYRVWRTLQPKRIRYAPVFSQHARASAPRARVN